MPWLYYQLPTVQLRSLLLGSTQELSDENCARMCQLSNYKVPDDVDYKADQLLEEFQSHRGSTDRDGRLTRLTLSLRG